MKLKVKRNVSNSFNNSSIYQFNTFEEFCNFCTYLDNSYLNKLKNFTKNISLYEYNAKYFLVLNNINPNSTDFALLNTSISEFAEMVSNSSLFGSKLLEYGKVIFKNNAIKNGIKYFCTKK